MGIIDGEGAYFFEPQARRESWTIHTTDENGTYADILTNNLTSESVILRTYPKPSPRETVFDRMRKYLGL